MLSAAKVLSENGYDVDVETDSPELIEKASKRFDLDISSLNAVISVNRGDGYDACVWLSDGSVPMLRARKNILHFQRPFQNVDGRSLLNRMKFFRINHIIVNSEFTKLWIDREYPVVSKVVYPPVDIKRFKVHSKEKMVLYVGRFSQLEQKKRQDVLIDTFKSFSKKVDGWKLVLAGGAEVGAGEEVNKLKEKAKGSNIEFFVSPGFKKLRELYGKASVFWSAAGYGVDGNKEPEKLEHFGITVVEAMAAGAVPIVYAAGGPKEIVSGGTGELWRRKNELLKKTVSLVEDKRRLRLLSGNARKHAQKYSYEEFEKSFLSTV